MAETNEPLSDELISAYLDGELSLEQRQSVERVLRQDARSRHLFDQLRAMQDSLRDLPPHELEDDLSEKVLQRIRSMSSSDDTSGAVVVPAASVETRRVASRGFRRGMVWAALTISAAVLLTLFQQQPELGDRQIAKAPAEQDEVARPEARDEARQNVPPPTDDDSVAGDQMVESLSVDNLAVESLSIDDEADIEDGLSDRAPKRSESPPAARSPQPMLAAPVTPSAFGVAPIRFDTILIAEVTPEQLTDVATRLQEKHLIVGRVSGAAENRQRSEATLAANDEDSAVGATGRSRLSASVYKDLAGIVVQARVADVQRALKEFDVTTVASSTGGVLLTATPSKESVRFRAIEPNRKATESEQDKLGVPLSRGAETKGESVESTAEELQPNVRSYYFTLDDTTNGAESQKRRRRSVPLDQRLGEGIDEVNGRPGHVVILFQLKDSPEEQE